MEKKICTIPPPKSSGQDLSNARGSSSSKQDVSGNNSQTKGFSRGNPRRKFESVTATNPNGSFRTDTSGRKVTAQKGKAAMEKKPRPRGNNPAESVSSRHEEHELGNGGGKKRNWNHLLAFHFAPRERTLSPSWRSHNSHPGRYRNDSGGAAAAGRSKFTKENFLQANCQFMVKGGADYSVYNADPDILVDWNSIEQIIVKMVGEGASCPICLGPPIAAKMTRCGHIFCWPCMLHYLALSDQKFRSCPICYEAVCKDDLKSVVANLHFDIEIGDRVDMQLICRPKDTLTVSSIFKNGVSADWDTLYSKLLIMTSDEVKELILDREMVELSARYEEDPDCPEVCFVHQAIQEVGIRKESVISAENTEAVGGAKVVTKNVAVAEDGLTVSPVRKIRTESIGSDSLAGSEDECLTGKNLDRNGHFYFYQACDGQNIFLHPVNMAMLWKGLGTDISQWPQRATFCVLEKEFYSVNDETRKRMKFLRHLPMSTPFQLVEVELQEPYVNSEILHEFGPQLQYRKLRREQRVKNEKHMDKMMEDREKQRYAMPPLPKIESKLEFPEFGDAYSEYVGFDSMLNPIEESPQDLTDDTTEYEASAGSPVGNAGPSSISFAQVAGRQAIKKSPTFPLSTALLRRPLETLTSRFTAGQRHSDSEPEAEDYVPVPEYRTSMSDAIAKALETVVFEGESLPVNSSGQQKKKKKNKGKVLFATGMGGYN